MKTVIPEGPWTVENLGWDLYEKLAIENGCLKPTSEFHPALDLTDAYNAQSAKPASKAKSAKAAEGGE